MGCGVGSGRLAAAVGAEQDLAARGGSALRAARRRHGRGARERIPRSDVSPLSVRLVPHPAPTGSSPPWLRCCWTCPNVCCGSHVDLPLVSAVESCRKLSVGPQVLHGRGGPDRRGVEADHRLAAVGALREGSHADLQQRLARTDPDGTKPSTFLPTPCWASTMPTRVARAGLGGGRRGGG